MNAAAALFERHGFGGTSIRAITDAARANLGAVTYYFKSKAALFSAVMEPKLGAMIRCWSAIAGGRETATQKLALLYREYVHTVLWREPSLRAVLSDALHGGDHLTHDIKTDLLAMHAIAASIIRKGIADGAFREENVDHAVRMVFGTIVPFLGIHQHMRGRRQMARFTRREAAAIADSGLALIMNGLFWSDRQRHRT